MVSPPRYNQGPEGNLFESLASWRLQSAGTYVCVFSGPILSPASPLTPAAERCAQHLLLAQPAPPTPKEGESREIASRFLFEPSSGFLILRRLSSNFSVALACFPSAVSLTLKSLWGDVLWGPLSQNHSH